MDALRRLILAAALQYGVPAELLQAVCRLEGFCGVHRPRSSQLYPRDEQPDRAAHALARWYRYCGSWTGALQYFHTGETCQNRPCPRRRGHHHRRSYAEEVFYLARHRWL